MKPELPWIGCDLLRLEYDFRSRIAILYLNEGDCVDMESAIKVITNIDPNARLVRTISGHMEDTMYRRAHKNEWTVAFMP